MFIAWILVSFLRSGRSEMYVSLDIPLLRSANLKDIEAYKHLVPPGRNPQHVTRQYK